MAFLLLFTYEKLRAVRESTNQNRLFYFSLNVTFNANNHSGKSIDVPLEETNHLRWLAYTSIIQFASVLNLCNHCFNSNNFDKESGHKANF